jgi:hypothetical protein
MIGDGQAEIREVVRHEETLSDCRKRRAGLPGAERLGLGGTNVGVEDIFKAIGGTEAEERRPVSVVANPKNRLTIVEVERLIRSGEE